MRLALDVYFASLMNEGIPRNFRLSNIACRQSLARVRTISVRFS